ncbi:hypothetical protein RJT34_08027 [Clitoria ternatea]|uniref:DRBM domain-containing protein n=1 Tax=Clitoria ternatea TaxID=43366 RepID=A0AAN9PSI8_CLITE
MRRGEMERTTTNYAYAKNALSLCLSFRLLSLASVSSTDVGFVVLLEHLFRVLTTSLRALSQPFLSLSLASGSSTDDSFIIVFQNSTFWKSILHEYVAKLNMEKPSYNTVYQGPLLPVFISSLVFNGTSYIGDIARSKTDAKQSAARAAILSILGNLNLGTMLIGISKSKSMLYNKHKGKALQDIHANLKDVRVGNSTFWKSIVHEYAVKLNLEKPAYNTVHQGSLFLVFTSSIVFNGTSYTSDPARSKKDVKQSVARATILSMMGHMF